MKTKVKSALLTGTIATIIIGVFALSTMQSCKKETTAATMTLYDSLGGTTKVQDPNATAGVMIESGRLAIRSVVDSTIFVIAADSKLNGFFTVLLSEVTSGNTSGLTELSGNITDFFCVATGSKNYKYTGMSMTDAHNPAVNNRMNGKAASTDFDNFITDLVAGATKNKVPAYLITRVGAVTETQRSLVVQR
jgi:hypothetical protein